MRIASKFALLIIIILGIGTILPLFHSGFFTFHDNTQVERVYEMGVALSDKVFPVRWVTNLGYGYGYPIFNFYGPAPYYIGGALVNAGFGSLASTKIMLALGVLLSGISMYYFSKRFFGPVGGIASALIYLYFPYHAVNIYVRGAVGEIYAYAFLPLIFLGIYKLSEYKKIKDIVQDTRLLVAIIAGIFLVATSHNLTMFMVMLLSVPAIIFCALLAKNKTIYFAVSIGSILIGILLSSFYIIPSFMEMSFTNIRSQIGGGANFSDHFLCLEQIWQSQWGFGGSVPGCIDGMSFGFGKFNILLLGVSACFILYSLLKKGAGRIEKVSIISLVLLLISVFMMTSYSRFVWMNIPYIEYIQYPWRFINFASLFLSFTIGYIFYILGKFNKTVSLIVVSILILIIVVTSVKDFNPQSFNEYTDEYYEQKDYISFTVSKISDEYLPPDFQKPLTESDIPREKFVVKSGEGIVKQNINRVDELKGVYAFSDDGIIHVNTAYFPAWKAFINKTEVKVNKVRDGMDIFVEKGSGEITLKFIQTPVEIIGNAVTVIVFLALLTVIIFFKSYAKKTT